MPLQFVAQGPMLIPAGGPWSPLTAGAEFWYDASFASAYTDAGVTLATDTQQVQQWNDRSGNGNHLTQATGANQPVYNTNIVNSKPGVRLYYTGNLRYFAVTLAHTVAQPFLLMAVFRKDGTALKDQASFWAYNLMLQNIFVGAPTEMKFSANSSTYLSSGVVIGTNSNYYCYALANGTSSKIRVSGGTEQTGDAATNSMTGFFLGGDPGNAATTSADSYLCEFFGIPFADDGTISNALAYVQAKWGV